MLCLGDSTTKVDGNVGDLMIISTTNINTTFSGSDNAYIRSSYSSTIGSVIYKSTIRRYRVCDRDISIIILSTVNSSYFTILGVTTCIGRCTRWIPCHSGGKDFPNV
jgi:hypothetical protein